MQHDSLTDSGYLFYSLPKPYF